MIARTRVSGPRGVLVSGCCGRLKLAFVGLRWPSLAYVGLCESTLAFVGSTLAFVGSTLAYVGHRWCSLVLVGCRGLRGPSLAIVDLRWPS